MKTFRSLIIACGIVSVIVLGSFIASASTPPETGWTSATPAGGTAGAAQGAVVGRCVRSSISYIQMIGGQDGAGNALTENQHVAPPYSGAETWVIGFAGMANASSWKFYGYADDTNRNRIYVFGGYISSVTPKLQIYDCNADVWFHSNKTSPDLGFWTSGTFDPDNGMVYAYTGQQTGGYASHFYSWNPATDTWTTLTAPADAQYYAEMGYANGAVWLLGGNRNGLGASTLCRYYTVSNATWSSCPSTPVTVYGGYTSEGGLKRGSRYMIVTPGFGDTRVWIFDTVGMTYSSTSALLNSYGQFSAMSIDNTAFLIGGSTGGNAFQEIMSDSFTINLPGSVATVAANPVGITGATVNGNLLSLGTSATVVVGFLWGTDPALAGATNVTVGTTGTLGIFSLSLDGLAASTKFYFEAWVNNSAGFAHGVILNFTTQADIFGSAGSIEGWLWLFLFFAACVLGLAGAWWLRDFRNSHQW